MRKPARRLLFCSDCRTAPSKEGGTVMQRGVFDAWNRRIRCGIVLSAGNGTRLQEFVRQQRGDGLPKQYVNFVGRRSMLEHTCDRAEKLIPAQRLFVVIAQEHLKYGEVDRQLLAKPFGQIVIQPQNKETAPGILLPLLHIHRRYPDAIVALFPSDHFVLEEDRFMRHVEHAFRLVEVNPTRMVTLGLFPQCPDPAYGYIVPGSDTSRLRAAKPVQLFVEKPPVEAARKIIADGGLWNTMVMVFACSTLLSVMRSTAPNLYQPFEAIQKAIGTSKEQKVIDHVYQNLPPVNFSTEIVEALSRERRRSLLVLPVRGVTWSDWGTSEHISGMVRLMGRLRFAKRTRVPEHLGVLAVDKIRELAVRSSFRPQAVKEPSGRHSTQHTMRKREL